MEDSEGNKSLPRSYSIISFAINEWEFIRYRADHQQAQTLSNARDFIALNENCSSDGGSSMAESISTRGTGELGAGIIGAS